MKDILYSITYDQQFGSMIGRGLKWLPWVGKNYSSSKHKVLVVGESHYGDENNKNVWEDTDSTRACIDEVMYASLWRNRTYTNITHLLKGEKYNDPVLWDNIAYYNFIQELMITRKQRPSDYYSAWEPFLKILQILKPDFVLFIGVTAANSFNAYMEDHEIAHSPIKFTESINNVEPRLATINENGINIDLYFIKHCGMGFTVDSWYNFLTKEKSHSMTFLANLDQDTLSIPEKKNIIENIFIPQLRDLGNQLGLTYIESALNIEDEPISFMFSNPQWEDFMLGFEFWEPKLKRLTYGFYTPKKHDERLLLLKKDSEGKSNAYWTFYEAYSYYNWNDYAFQAIKDGRMFEFFKVCIEDYLFNVAKNIKL